MLPEVWTQYLDALSSGVQKVIWWLSVDNNGGSFKAFRDSAAQGVVHVSNSQYGVEYLRYATPPPKEPCIGDLHMAKEPD